MRFRVICLALALLVPVKAQAAELIIHVSPNGSDEWSGTADKQDGVNGPVKSLNRALEVMRKARETEERPSRLLIQLQNGRYELAESIIVTPEDSGLSAQVPLEIAAAPNAKPILSGGRALNGWTKDESNPNLWKARVPKQGGTNWVFRQLFIDGKRATPARTPNEGFFTQEGDALSVDPFSFKFRAGDLKPEWAAQRAEIVAFHKWIDLRHPIAELNMENRVVKLAGKIAQHVKEANARYVVENVRDALDKEGEWFLDAPKETVYYLAKAGEDLTSKEIIAPFLEGGVVRFQGSSEAGIPVRKIVLRGLTFAETNWRLPQEGYLDTQAAVRLRGEILAEGAVDCAIEQCTFTRLAGYGLELGAGCQNWTIERNEFLDLGAGAVRLGEARQTKPTKYQANFGHKIVDNEMHRLGRMFPAAVGIFIQQSGHNLVAHNHIHDLYYTGISVGWNWGYQETPCRENRIEFNHIHNIGQGMLSDMGGIYTLGIQRGTMLRNNLIHDVTSFGYGGWGIYPDEGSSHILIESNVVYRTKSAGFHQHYGKENIVRNNIFAFGKEHQLMRSRDEEHVSFILDRNIVIFDSGTLLGSTWKNNKFASDYNVFWDTRKAGEAMKFSDATLAEWRARGHDNHSVIADPLFENANEFKFKLKERSPALNLGIGQIDIDTVGVRKP